MSNFQLINIETDRLNGEEVQVVCAKELFEYLELEATHYSRWIKKNLINNSYAIENQDFCLLAIDGEQKKRGNFSKDYHLKTKNQLV